MRTKKTTQILLDSLLDMEPTVSFLGEVRGAAMGGAVDGEPTLKWRYRFRFAMGRREFVVNQFIAKGHFGECYFAESDDSEAKVKVVLKSFLGAQKLQHEPGGRGWTSELANLRAIPREALTHRNILTVLHVGDGPMRPSCHGFLLLEACSNGELLSYLRGAFSERMVRHFVRDLLRAVAHMHAHCVVHRDLKAENILIDSRGRLLVADFGTCKFFRDASRAVPPPTAVIAGAGPPPMPMPMPAPTDDEGAPQWARTTTEAGTPAFKSPQMRREREYDADKLDTFGVAVIAFILLHNELPFGMPRASGGVGVSHALLSQFGDGDESNPRFWTKFREKLSVSKATYPTYYPHATLSADTERFLNRSMRMDAARVPAAAELLRDPWLEGADDAERYPTAAVYINDLTRRKPGTLIDAVPEDFAPEPPSTPRAQCDAIPEDPGVAALVPILAAQLSLSADAGSSGVIDPAFRQSVVLRFIGAADGVQLCEAVRATVADGPVGGVALRAEAAQSPRAAGQIELICLRPSDEAVDTGTQAPDSFGLEVKVSAAMSVDDCEAHGAGGGAGGCGAVAAVADCAAPVSSDVASPEVRVHLTVMPHYSDADGFTLRILRRQGSAVSVNSIIRHLHRLVASRLAQTGRSVRPRLT